MNNLFLEDVNNTFKYQLLESGQDSKNFYIRGVVSKAGALNKNKRIYPMEVMREAISSLQEEVRTGGFVGELSHPSTPAINLDKISHKITKIDMADDGSVLAEMFILNTTMGRELKELIRGGVKLGVSTRATGGVKPCSSLGEGVVEVQKGLKIKAIDVVFDPSAGEYGRPDFVVESLTESNILLGYEGSKFESVWNDVFDK